MCIEIECVAGQSFLLKLGAFRLFPAPRPRPQNVTRTKAPPINGHLMTALRSHSLAGVYVVPPTLFF